MDFRQIDFSKPPPGWPSALTPYRISEVTMVQRREYHFGAPDSTEPMPEWHPSMHEHAHPAANIPRPPGQVTQPGGSQQMYGMPSGQAMLQWHPSMHEHANPSPIMPRPPGQVTQPRECQKNYALPLQHKGSDLPMNLVSNKPPVLGQPGDRQQNYAVPTEQAVRQWHPSMHEPANPGPIMPRPPGQVPQPRECQQNCALPLQHKGSDLPMNLVSNKPPVQQDTVVPPPVEKRQYNLRSQTSSQWHPSMHEHANPGPIMPRPPGQVTQRRECQQNYALPIQHKGSDQPMKLVPNKPPVQQDTVVPPPLDKREYNLRSQTSFQNWNVCLSSSSDDEEPVSKPPPKRSLSLKNNDKFKQRPKKIRSILDSSDDEEAKPNLLDSSDTVEDKNKPAVPSISPMQENIFELNGEELYNCTTDEDVEDFQILNQVKDLLDSASVDGMSRQCIVAYFACFKPEPKSLSHLPKLQPVGNERDFFELLDRMPEKLCTNLKKLYLEAKADFQNV